MRRIETGVLRKDHRRGNDDVIGAVIGRMARLLAPFKIRRVASRGVAIALPNAGMDAVVALSKAPNPRHLERDAG